MNSVLPGDGNGMNSILPEVLFPFIAAEATRINALDAPLPGNATRLTPQEQRQIGRFVWGWGVITDFGLRIVDWKRRIPTPHSVLCHFLLSTFSVFLASLLTSDF